MKSLNVNWIYTDHNVTIQTLKQPGNNKRNERAWQSRWE